VSGLESHLKHRRRLLRQIKGWVRGYVGRESPSIKSYSLPYEKEFIGRWRESNVDELFSEVDRSRVIFGADFHGFAQAQRTHLRVLRRLSAKKPVLLALEIFESRHQKTIESFMDGTLSEDELLARVKWDSHWGFPWKQYKPLLELARRRGYKVVGINKCYGERTGQTLRRRDQFAAEKIADLIRESPESLVYVIYGDLHLASSHLPKLVLQTIKHKPRHVILYQNSERLYFSLAQKGLEKRVHVMKKGNRFCVLSSPPWVKWQSYLLFLEGTLDRDLFSDEADIDLTAHIKNLIQIITGDLKIKIDVKDIAVYGPEDEGLEFALSKRLTKAELKTANLLKSSGRSFFIPDGGIFFLAHASVNHAATLAGEYIQARMSGRNRIVWSMPDDFSAAVWIETLSFFLSKFINHRRKPDTIRDVRVKAPRLSREVILLVLEQKLDLLYLKIGKRRGKTPFRPRQRASYLWAARILGGLYGERMFGAFQSGFIVRRDVLSWITQDVQRSGFSEVFNAAMKKLEKIPAWARHSEKRL
jgi:hypothetical protein